MTRHAVPSRRRAHSARVLRGLMVAAFATAATLTLLFVLVRRAGAQTQAPLAPGAPSAGNLTSRLGDAWQLYGCAGDVVTVTAVSSAFSPYLELYAPAQTTPQAEAGGDESMAQIAGAPLTQTGVYTLSVLGERLSARGPYTVAATFAGAPTPITSDAPDGFAAVGQSVTGTLASRFGDLWQVHLCGGAPVTLTLQSTAFAPLLDLGEDLPGTLADISSAAAGADAAAVQWTAAVFTPSLTMDLQLIAGGEKRSDRGPYTLRVETAAVAAAEGAALAAAPTKRPSLAPTRTPTAAPTRTPAAAAAPACRVLVQGLRLRSGPGTQYEPPVAGLALDTALDVLGRSADSGWINVRVQGGGLSGWVSAGAQYVTCNVPIATLAVVQAPPTPTATNTPLPVPTSTPTKQPEVAASPTPEPLAFVIPGLGGGGGGANVTANLRTGSGVARNQDGVAVFTDQLWFLADIGTEPGRTVKRVHFRITSSNQQDFSYERDEGTAAFCVFGGGEPNCNVLWLRDGAVWPGTDIPVRNDTYTVRIDITLENDDSTNRDTEIRIQSPNLPNLPDVSGAAPAPAAPPAEPADIHVELREVGPGSTDPVVDGQIVFQVAAWDPSVGTHNGDGIDLLYMELYDDSGTVHERTERTAGYCAFGGGEPDCNVYDYASAGYVWDSGVPVTPGSLTLTTDVYATDGRVVTYSWNIEVR